MNTVLLDTNAYSAYTEKDRRIKKAIDHCLIAYISTIVLGELLAGFENGSMIKRNLRDLDAFLSDKRAKMLTVSKKTAYIYGKLFVELSKKGKPIPTNDIWIAAHVLETGSTLITYDNHFLGIPNLKVWNEIKI